VNDCMPVEKRVFDICLSFLGLVITFPVLLIIGVAVRFSSAGPIFYSQLRIGRQGKPFTCIKFRTMFIGADQKGSITTSNDKRITVVGKVLRSTKLDVLPQLVNVLIGTMSFVGPRPDVPGYADKLQGNSRDILKLRPGITSPASLYFRNEEKLLAKAENPKEYNDTVIWPKKVQINLEYYRNWSFWKDIGYILMTVFPSLDRIFGLVPMADEEIMEK
jgi:lipopolysaccharide/colanic/teichoic acid biosynthesis glycosyltransferase